MVSIETLEGVINGTVSYHYDVFADVLYLRLIDQMETPSLGDLTDDGDILLRDEHTNAVVGLTCVSWWKRFGHGPRPDSISEIQKRIEPLARKVSA